MSIQFVARCLPNLAAKPCTVALISNVGIGKGFSSVISFRNISVCQGLKSTLPSTFRSSGTHWKPLSDPEANKETLKRLVAIGTVAGSIIFGFIWIEYTLFFQWPPEVARITEWRKQGKL